MDYIIFGAIIVILLLIIVRYVSKKNHLRKIEELRIDWGKPKDESFDFPRIRRYAYVTEQAEYHKISEQTIRDIDFEELFKFIDRTTSKVGQQFLYKKLTEPSNKTEDKDRFLKQIFTENKILREEAQIELLKLNDDDAYYLYALLGDGLLKKPKWFNLLYFDVTILFVLVLASIQFPALLIVMIVPVTLNVLLHYWNKSKVYQIRKAIPQLNLLIQISEYFSKKNEAFLDRTVLDSINELKPIQRLSRVISFEGNGFQSELSQLGTYILDLTKAALLIEFFSFFKIVEKLEAKRSHIQNLFNYVGRIDTCISVVALRSGVSKTCEPEFVSDKKQLVAKKIYHPLVPKCVGNDLTVESKSILITGSNMSGKSTFLRALLINSIFAQTIYTCFADEFKSPILMQFSSIKISDDLFHGSSYYFQEVKVMGTLIDKVESSQQNLFILDEVFKGTNTIERISSAKAILSYLNKQTNIVVVSTHDIELVEFLKKEYDLFHFSELIENEKLTFDYQLKNGELKSRNAIKILELSDYPSEIIDEARQISTELSASKQIS